MPSIILDEILQHFICPCSRVNYIIIFSFRSVYQILTQLESDTNWTNQIEEMPSEKSKKIKKMKDEFLELDFDGDGSISINELERVVHSLRIKLKLKESDIREFLQEIDRDGNGNVDLKEYFKYMKGKIGTPLHSNLLYRILFQLSLIRKDFHKFDIDGSGYITKNELLKVVNLRTNCQLSEEEIDHVFEDTDLNHDGKIDYEEFVILMTK